MPTLTDQTWNGRSRRSAPTTAEPVEEFRQELMRKMNQVIAERPVHSGGSGA